VNYADVKKYLDGEKIKSRVHRLGVELEGGWSKVQRISNSNMMGVYRFVSSRRNLRISTQQSKSNVPRILGALLPFKGEYRRIHTGRSRV